MSFETGQIPWKRQTSNLSNNQPLQWFFCCTLWLEGNEGVFTSSSLPAISKGCWVMQYTNPIATEWMNSWKLNLPINTWEKCQTWKESSKGKKITHMLTDQAFISHLLTRNEMKVITSWEMVVYWSPSWGKEDVMRDTFLPSPCNSYVLGVVSKVSTWAEL